VAFYVPTADAPLRNYSLTHVWSLQKKTKNVTITFNLLLIGLDYCLTKVGGLLLWTPCTTTTNSKHTEGTNCI